MCELKKYFAKNKIDLQMHTFNNLKKIFEYV